MPACDRHGTGSVGTRAAVVSRDRCKSTILSGQRAGQGARPFHLPPINPPGLPSRRRIRERDIRPCVLRVTGRADQLDLRGGTELAGGNHPPLAIELLVRLTDLIENAEERYGVGGGGTVHQIVPRTTAGALTHRGGATPRCLATSVGAGESPCFGLQGLNPLRGRGLRVLRNRLRSAGRLGLTH